jgi:hypothetical protein
MAELLGWCHCEITGECSMIVLAFRTSHWLRHQYLLNDQHKLSARQAESEGSQAASDTGALRSHQWVTPLMVVGDKARSIAGLGSSTSIKTRKLNT